MTPERWRRIREVFDEASGRAGADRVLFLDSACAADPLLRSEVESLLASSEAAASFLERPAGHEGGDRGRVGSYEIVREIGHGGMGTVYLAVRPDEFRKQVALKIVRRGMDTELVLRHFRNERQILAALEHPYIARFLDGGSTDDGLPFFVMEHVEGDPIDLYVVARKLTPDGCLALFQRVCSAVQYAHQNLVVHRDLKPGNILVTADGLPKLLDFGIAKLLQPEGSGETLPLTATALRLLTPEYASPEQIRGEKITTASDVYSLGVLLYELLTGQRPYRLASRGSGEIVDAIADAVLTQEPARPSTRRPGIHTDLDNIVAMAMRKEPARRYASVAQLSEDIGRHLEGLPVQARKDTFVYRAGKFVRRHRGGVAASVLVALSLLGGIAATAWEARVARAERARAERRFNDVRKLANAYLFEFHDAVMYLPGSTPVRQLLVKRALEYLNSLAQEAGNEPALQRELAAAYQKVANVQGHIASANMGDTQGARRSYGNALALREALVQANPGNREDESALAHILGQVSQLLDSLGDHPGSLLAARRSVALRERLVGSEAGNAELQRGLALSLHYLASALGSSGEHRAALESYRREKEVFAALTATDPASARFRWGLACAAQGMGAELQALCEPGAALEALNEAFTVLERLAVEKPDHASIRRGLGESHQLIGECRRDLGERDAAIVEERKALEIREAWSARDPEDADGRVLLAETRSRLGRLLVESGHQKDGVVLLRQAETSLTKESAADAANIFPRRLLGETRSALRMISER
ncbi:MAG: serine/threonine-protein kinase [Thermoanaerobaculia bacterium]